MNHTQVISTESQQFADVLADAAPDADCPTCPEWDAADLLWHLTEVQLFWAGVLGQNARTDAEVESVEQANPERPASLHQTLALREQATTALVSRLNALDDSEPRWSWWEPDQTVGFTRRMQTYEATMHRVDAELTAGLAIGAIAPDVAAGAVDHCVDVMWGWKPDWAPYEGQALAEFVATDTGGRWLVEVGHWYGTGPESGTQFDEPRAIRAQDGEATVTVRGPVADLALWAWTRGGTVQVSGQPQSRAALDALIANGIP